LEKNNGGRGRERKGSRYCIEREMGQDILKPPPDISSAAYASLRRTLTLLEY